MFDPSGGEHYGFGLRGERLVDGEYRTLEMRENADGGTWGYSPTLGLEFHWIEGSLRLYDPVGERWLQTPTEIEESRESAEARAESERVAREFAESRADAEREARETAEVRAAELEAELRRLRGWVGFHPHPSPLPQGEGIYVAPSPIEGEGTVVWVVLSHPHPNVSPVRPEGIFVEGSPRTDYSSDA